MRLPGAPLSVLRALNIYKGQVVGQDPPGKCIKLNGFACRKKQDPLKRDWIPLGSPVDPLWIPHGSPLRNRLLEHMHMLIFCFFNRLLVDPLVVYVLQRCRNLFAVFEATTARPIQVVKDGGC